MKTVPNAQPLHRSNHPGLPAIRKTNCLDGLFGLTLTRFFPICLLLLVLGGTLTAPVRAESRFNRDIKPILSEYCVQCHGPDEENREAELRLDLATDAKKRAIIAGKPEKSPLFKRIISHDPDLVMPPPDSKKTLSPKQIETLKQWIADGAPYEGHWAFEPIRDAKPPEVASKSPNLTDIDRFIVQKQEAVGLKLSPQINRQQLIRRATLDLTGLPPTWDEIQNFVNDKSPDAYQKVLDRLLNSPRYGERWGRHWLDLARYADTLGGSAIGFQKFPYSYTYRDYVINAFNADLPYDRFITEQIAADQLGLPENDPALAGLGFLTVGMQFRNRNDVIDDQIDVTMRGLMGLTVACARCHDHKYDPIPTSDYYSLYATFGSSGEPDMPPIVGREPDTQDYRNYEKELETRQALERNMARDQAEVMRNRLRMQVGVYLAELAKGTPEQDLSAAFLSYRTDDIRPIVLNRWRDYLAAMPADDPVFGPWVVLAKLVKEAPEKFAEKVREIVASGKKANGDPATFGNQNNPASGVPKVNPRVLETLEKKAPRTLLEVADAYGRLFADVHREWLKALIEASLEAAPDGTLIPDEDARHLVVNSAIDQQLRRHLLEAETPTAVDDKLAVTILNRTVSDSLNAKSGSVENLQLTSPGSPPRAMSLEEGAVQKPFRIFRRGNPLDRGDVVQAHFLTALSPDQPPRNFPDGKRRLALAQSLTSPENPLFRRVIVNWVWLHHFGRGFAQTPDDFGVRSRPPTHPELLDYLACRLVDDGWSIKKLQRRIMLSQVYQQAATENAEFRQIDADNELLWRMPRRRLDMESMRDSLLAVSGELNADQTGGRPFDLEAKPVVMRRSVYGFINRDIINSFSSTFDAANPTTCTMNRLETTVPQQTLFALNSDFIQDRAIAFARNAMKFNEPEDRVRYLYRSALGRDPAPDEIQSALGFIAGVSGNPEQKQEPGQDQAQDQKPKQDQDQKKKQNEIGMKSWEQLAHVILASNEFVFAD